MDGVRTVLRSRGALSQKPMSLRIPDGSQYPAVRAPGWNPHAGSAALWATWRILGTSAGCSPEPT